MRQESNSELASTPLLVRKWNGEILHIEYRVLNKFTVKDALDIPFISQCLDQLDGCTTNSCLDLVSGSHLVLIPEADHHKTAFITRFGWFEHKRLAFGLSDSPSTLCCVMALVLLGLT